MAALSEILDKLVAVNPAAAAPPAFTTRALSSPVVIYHLGQATDREVKAVMACLTLLGRSGDKDPKKWQCWVLTWSCLVFPELVSRMRDSVNRNDYQFEALAPEFVASCVDSIRRQADATTVGDVFLAFPASLPAGTLTPMTPQVAQTAPSVEGLYAYYAMVVYILGKSLSPDTESAIAVKRPSALIRKRQLATSEYILTGDGKILPDNYGKVQGGWVRSTEPRVVIVTHLATLYSASSRPESLDSIVVNMDMLKNAGQSYIYYVYELLVACDWCLEIPILAAQYRHFSRMVNILTRQPQHIQPFYKMMMQDATKDVRRREIEHIVGVSIFYASQTRASITNYRISAECRPVIDAFIALAATKGITFREVTGQATIDVTAV